MLSYSMILFNEQNGTRPIKDIALYELMQQNLSKTNPVHTTKAKAFDLANAIPNSLVSDLSFYGLVFLLTTKIADFISFAGHVAAQK